MAARFRLVKYYNLLRYIPCFPWGAKELLRFFQSHYGLEDPLSNWLVIMEKSTCLAARARDKWGYSIYEWGTTTITSYPVTNFEVS